MMLFTSQVCVHLVVFKVSLHVFKLNENAGDGINSCPGK